MIEPKPFEFTVDWFIDCMSASGFSSEEIKRVSFIAPLEDPTCRMMRGGIRYYTDGICQIYQNNFLVEVDALVKSSVVNILNLHYERLIDILGKELPKIRQIEKATKRLLGEPKLQNTHDRGRSRRHVLHDRSRGLSCSCGRIGPNPDGQKIICIFPLTAVCKVC